MHVPLQALGWEVGQGKQESHDPNTTLVGAAARRSTLEGRELDSTPLSLWHWGCQDGTKASSRLLKAGDTQSVALTCKRYFHGLGLVSKKTTENIEAVKSA